MNIQNNKILDSYFIIHDSEGNLIETEKYFRDLTDEIRKRKIDILFVALGFPKQEYFINELKVISDKLEVKRPIVMMGVGGSLDYIAGRVKRAPDWMRERGLEWLYRLINEPWRIKRQLIGGQFFLRILLTS